MEKNFVKQEKNSPGERAESPSPAQESWVFTFGFGHTHPVTGDSLANCYIKVRGDINETRQAMERAFGNKWAFQYRDEEAAGVEKYKLNPLIAPVWK